MTKAWPEMKAQGMEDGSIPYGQMPTLEIDGMTLAQSTSILRYVGRKFVPCDKTFALADMVTQGWDDLLNKYYQVKYVNTDGLAAFLESKLAQEVRLQETIYKRFGVSCRVVCVSEGGERELRI